MQKFSGNDIITIIRTSQKNNEVLKEASSLNRSDFNDDLLVDYFFEAHPDGFASAEAPYSKTADALSLIKKQIVDRGIRKAFFNVQLLNGNHQNLAATLENEVGQYHSANSFKKETMQNKTAGLTNFLSTYVSGEKNKTLLKAASKKIEENSYQEAAELIKSAFINTTDGMTKTAFVTVKQQIGENYQMCPKAIYQSGRPIPMAISNCREYCIDSRLHPDGSVGCNYVKWLNENLITQKQALNLFDTVKISQETMNLEKNQRSKFPMSDQDSLDSRIKRENNTSEQSWEEQLEQSHKITPKTAEPSDVVYTNSALEKLLENCREVFDEDDLDFLEARLNEEMGRK